MEKTRKKNKPWKLHGTDRVVADLDKENIDLFDEFMEKNNYIERKPFAQEFWKMFLKYSKRDQVMKEMMLETLKAQTKLIEKGK